VFKKIADNGSIQGEKKALSQRFDWPPEKFITLGSSILVRPGS